MEEDLEKNIKEAHDDHSGKKAQMLNSSSCSSMARKKSDPIDEVVRFQTLRNLMTNLQEVIFGTKLAVLFPAIPLAVAADFYSFGRVCHNRLSL